MDNIMRTIRGMRETLIRVGIFFLLLIIFGIINPAVISPVNLVGLVNNSIFTALACIGLMVVMVTGSFDMSSTAIAMISFYTTAYIYRLFGYQGDYISGFLLSGCIGAAVALISMWISVKFNLSGFVVSLGINLIYSSVLFIFVNGYISQSDMPQQIIRLSHDSIFSVESEDGTRATMLVSVIFLVILAVVVWFILNHTQLGRGIYALGGDKMALERVGYNVMSVYILAYVIFGFCTGVAGLVFYGNMSTAEPSHIIKGGSNIIAAAIFGGVDNNRGKGTVGGVLAGVFIITLINNNLTLLGASPYLKTLLIGVILLVSVLVTSLGDIKARRG